MRQALKWLTVVLGIVVQGWCHAGEPAHLSPYDMETGVCTMVKRGFRFEEAGEFLKALEAFKAAQRIEVGEPAHLIRMARALIGLGRYLEAEETLKQALERDSASSQSWLHLGVLYAKWGRMEEARRRLLGAHRLDPASPWVMLNLSQVHAVGMDEARAAALLEGPDWALPSSGNVIRWNNLAVAWFRMGESGKASAALARAVKALPPDGPWRRDAVSPKALRDAVSLNGEVISGRAPAHQVRWLVDWQMGPGPRQCPLSARPEAVGP